MDKRERGGHRERKHAKGERLYFPVPSGSSNKTGSHDDGDDDYSWSSETSRHKVFLRLARVIQPDHADADIVTTPA